MKHFFIVLVTILVIAGCTSKSTLRDKYSELPSPITFANLSLFKVKNVPEESEIFKLPAAEQQRFLARYAEFLAQGLRADVAISKYLERSVSGFTYDGETLTANQALIKQQGNCVSLAILTQAYASLAGIDTTFLEVSTYPIFKKQHDLMLVSSHFSTKLFAPKQQNEQQDKNWIQIIRAGTVVDYFPEQSTFFIGNAKYQDLVSKYYSNLASEALLNNDYDLSFSLIQQAIKVTPYDPDVINFLAVLHRRVGDVNTAKHIFEFALEHNLVNSNLIASYRVLAIQLNDQMLVKKLELKLEETAATPFDYLEIANREIYYQNFNKAEKIIFGVIDKYSYLPEPYFALSKVYYLKGDNKTAAEYLQQAINKSDSQEKTGMYQAKLKSLELTLAL